MRRKRQNATLAGPCRTSGNLVDALTPCRKLIHLQSGVGRPHQPPPSAASPLSGRSAAAVLLVASATFTCIQPCVAFSSSQKFTPISAHGRAPHGRTTLTLVRRYIERHTHANLAVLRLTAQGCPSHTPEVPRAFHTAHVVLSDTHVYKALIWRSAPLRLSLSHALASYSACPDVPHNLGLAHCEKFANNWNGPERRWDNTVSPLPTIELWEYHTYATVFPRLT